MTTQFNDHFTFFGGNFVFVEPIGMEYLIYADFIPVFNVWSIKYFRVSVFLDYSDSILAPILS